MPTAISGPLLGCFERPYSPRDAATAADGEPARETPAALAHPCCWAHSPGQAGCGSAALAGRAPQLGGAAGLPLWQCVAVPAARVPSACCGWVRERLRANGTGPKPPTDPLVGGLPCQDFSRCSSTSGFGVWTSFRARPSNRPNSDDGTSSFGVARWEP